MPKLITLGAILSEKFEVVITRQKADQVHQFITRFELRKDHPMAFNTAMLGVHRAKWLNSDRDFLFDLFGIDVREFQRAAIQSPAIVAEWKVISDPYNILVIWLCHLMLGTNLPEVVKRQFMHDLIALMNYKFFTSVVYNSHRYPADAEVMALAIETLSAKYDIKQDATNTWAKTIHARADDIIDIDGIHGSTFRLFAPDAKIAYLISDAQTRIRSRIVKLNKVYYDLKREGVRLGDRSLSTSVKGETILKHIDASFDQMIAGVTGAATQVDRMIRADDINLVCRLVSLKQEDMFRRMLNKFVDEASAQAAKQQYDLIPEVSRGKSRIYVGYRILLTKIIQTTYEVLARESKLDIKNRADILIRTVNMYRSSRVSSPEITAVKDSINAMITRYDLTRREATRSSLKIAFVTYAILLGLRYM